MKTAVEHSIIKTPVIRIDPTMDKRYEGKIIAPEKLEKLNEELRTNGIPDFMKKNP